MCAWARSFTYAHRCGYASSRLTQNYDRLNVRTGHYTPLPFGSSPLARPLQQHLNYGSLLLDKPANPSSHEVGVEGAAVPSGSACGFAAV